MSLEVLELVDGGGYSLVQTMLCETHLLTGKITAKLRVLALHFSTKYLRICAIMRYRRPDRKERTGKYQGIGFHKTAPPSRPLKARSLPQNLADSDAKQGFESSLCESYTILMTRSLALRGWHGGRSTYNSCLHEAVESPWSESFLLNRPPLEYCERESVQILWPDRILHPNASGVLTDGSIPIALPGILTSLGLCVLGSRLCLIYQNLRHLGGKMRGHQFSSSTSMLLRSLFRFQQDHPVVHEWMSFC
jgi:hypothetical protein